MKEVTADKIRNILKSQWPGLRHIWLFDRRYLLLIHEEIKQTAENINVILPFRYEVFDCDDYALVTHAFIKLRYARHRDIKYNVAFGEAMIQQSDHTIHILNIFISLSEAIWFYDPQLKEMKRAEITDKIHYVRM